MFSDLFFRLRSLFRRSAVEADLDDELRFHFEQQISKYVESGLTLEEAKRRARIEIGGLDQIKEECRQARGLHLLETTLQDLRYGVRMLRRSPMFTIVAVLTLSLGIGVNTAIFSMVDWFLLRSLPVPNADQLTYLVVQHKAGYYSNGFSYPNFEDIRQQTRSIFSSVAGVQLFQRDGLSAEGNTAGIWTNYVSGDFFPMLGIRPALGRFILPSEGKVAGGDPVLVITYSYWQTRFAGDPKIVGKTVAVNGNPVKIIGVAPKGFHGALGLLDTQGFFPLGMAALDLVGKRDFLTNRQESVDILLFARLRPGVNLAQAQPVLDVVSRRLAQQYPEADDWKSLRAFRLGARPPSSSGSSPVPMIAGIFLFLAGLVLLLACVNIANLLLVRAGVRQREMAVRSALGAARLRLIRQNFTESLLLALLGCAGGIVLGFGGTRALRSIPLGSAMPILLDFAFSWHVFAYAVGAAVLTALMMGIVPALRGSRVNLSELLHEGGRSLMGSHQKLRSILVVAEVSGSLALLIIAGLFLRSLQMVQHVDLGFDPDGVFNISMDPHEAGYDSSKGRQFVQDLLARVRNVPGVQTATVAASVPMGLYDYGSSLKISGYQPGNGEDNPSAGYNSVTPGYFTTMRIPLLHGRDFLAADDLSAQRVAVVNEAMAKKYWGNQNPIGGSFALGDNPGHTIEVVGIAKDSRTDSISNAIEPYFYLPFAQKYVSPATLQVRMASADPSPAISAISGIIRTIAPAMPIFDVKTMRGALETPNGLLLYEIGAGVSGALGTLGLLLALIGVYGVVSYSAVQRTQEIGVRMALGASRPDVLKTIFQQSLLLVGLGIIAGTLFAAAISRLVGNLLIGVRPLDPVTYAGASGFLALIALIACYVPAHRAVRADPMIALRHE